MADRKRLLRLTIGLVVLMTSTCYCQQSVDLRANHVERATSRVTLTLELKGNVQKDVQVFGQGEVQPAKPVEKTVRLPLRVAGRLMYDEVLTKLLADGQTRTTASNASVRYYHHAQANVQVGKQSDRLTLRENCRVLTVDESSLTSADGPMTRDELDLVEVPGNSLLVDRLLPNKPVAVGANWVQGSEELGQLLNWSEVANGEIECHLKQLENGLAIVSLRGSLAGTCQGAEANVEMQGEYRYDTHWGRITWLQLDLDETRQPGLVHPSFDVVSELRMRVEPLASSSVLTAAVVDGAMKSQRESQSLLVLQPQASDVELVHDRRWHVTGDLPRRTVLRCLNDNTLLAQLTVSELARLPDGRELSLEAFQADIQRALGDRFREFVSANKSQAGDFRTLRVVASGVVGEVPIQWIYYHLNDESGRRVAHVYILESENLEEFAQTDQQMLAGFRFRPRSSSAMDSDVETDRQQTTSPRSVTSQSTANRSSQLRKGNGNRSYDPQRDQARRKSPQRR